MSVLLWLIAGVLVGVITALIMDSKLTGDTIAATIGALLSGSAYALISRSGDALGDIFWQFRWESFLASILGAVIFAIAAEIYLSSSPTHKLGH